MKKDQELVRKGKVKEALQKLRWSVETDEPSLKPDLDMEDLEVQDEILAAIDALTPEPVPGRSELEQRIRRAIEYCDQKVGETIDHARIMWQADADAFRAILELPPRFGKDRSSLFQPSTKKGGTGGKED